MPEILQQEQTSAILASASGGTAKLLQALRKKGLDTGLTEKGLRCIHRDAKGTGLSFYSSYRTEATE